MYRPPSLTLRLTLLFGLSAAIVFSIFGWLIDRSIERHFVAGDSAELTMIANAVTRTLSTTGFINDSPTLLERFNDLTVGHHGAMLYIVDENNNRVFASVGSIDLAGVICESIDDCTNKVVHMWKDEHHSYRVLAGAISRENSKDGLPYRFAIAVTIDYHLHFLSEFRRTLWLMIVTAILVTAMMGWFAVRQGHAPLRHIVTQIHNISASKLNSRLPLKGVPRELIDLAQSFNDMLARMEESFQRLSNFSADIAHELRTPITSLLTQTQVALGQSRNAEEYREILYSNIEEYERLAQMINDMLFLAKTDNNLYMPNAVSINLCDEVCDLFEYYEAWAEERGVALATEGSATIEGDKLMIRRALSNLLSNAIRHTPSGNVVHVNLMQSSNQQISITIENPGPTIAPEHIPRLFDRFYRADVSRSRDGEGAGLGLAIVKSIVDIHGGTIEVSSTKSVTRFIVTLPRFTR